MSNLNICSAGFIRLLGSCQNRILSEVWIFRFWKVTESKVVHQPCLISQKLNLVSTSQSGKPLTTYHKPSQSLSRSPKHAKSVNVCQNYPQENYGRAYHFWLKQLSTLQELHFHFLSQGEGSDEWGSLNISCIEQAIEFQTAEIFLTRIWFFLTSWIVSSLHPSTWVAGSASKKIRSKETRTGSWPSLLHGTWYKEK